MNDVLGMIIKKTTRLINGDKENDQNIRIHSTYTTIIYIVCGIFISLVQFISEEFNRKLKSQFVSKGFGFFYSFLITFVVLRKFPKFTIQTIALSISFIVFIMISVTYFHIMHLMYLISTIIIILLILKIDTLHKYKNTHYLSVGIIILCNIIFDICYFKHDISPSFYLITILGSLCLSFCLYGYQYILQNGNDIYNFIGLQGFIGFLVFFIVAFKFNEFSFLPYVSYNELFYICLDSFGELIVIYSLPFYTKKCFCLIVINFFYWRFALIPKPFIILYHCIFGGCLGIFFFYKIDNKDVNKKIKKKDDKNIDFFFYNDFGTKEKVKIIEDE